MLKENTDDCAQSERATFICLYDWLFHSSDEKLRLRAKEMTVTFESILGQMPETERKMLNKEKLAAIRSRMDELSKLWSALKVDRSIILEWSLK